MAKKNIEINVEEQRRQDHYSQKKNWLTWGPYLSERQWGTVREDYSENGTAWDYFTHDHARSRTYRWGEDGLAGISDDHQQLCFAVALWNGKDPILKERLFGLTGSEGNHGEDVKELYYYLDSTPTHSYMRHLYKYPQAAFPYEDLVNTNWQRSKEEGEYELLDTGVFHDQKYFDVYTEYAKLDNEDILIKITIRNNSDAPSQISVLPTLWYRNQWTFGLIDQKPEISLVQTKGTPHAVKANHPVLGNYYLYFDQPNRYLFTENETNTEKLFGEPNTQPRVKDSFHHAVIQRDFSNVTEVNKGTKFTPLFENSIPAKGSLEIKLRLTRQANQQDPLGKVYEDGFKLRQQESNTFFKDLIKLNVPKTDTDDLVNIHRQSLAGLLWSKQYFNIDIPKWLDGDKGQPAPPASRKNGRNHQWMHLNNVDIISMPDKWEYPWYAAWDLAFHCVPIAQVDPDFAKNQLILFLREWYMHPNGQIPAYEWAFGDVNPPVHAWSCLQVFKADKARTGKDDYHFLKRVFSKLLLNFTWWVNRKDAHGKNVFEGGFLGLDNIGVFDRSSSLPGGGHLEQADGTAWMAMYCLNMLEMSLLLCEEDNSYEDVATKFFEHFVYITESLNRLAENWTGAWDEEEGFFYDILALPDNEFIPLKVRSLVGLSTMFAALHIPDSMLNNVPEFKARLDWFVRYRKDITHHQVIETSEGKKGILLSLTPKKRLERLLRAMLDEKEFLSPGGIRSVSKIHENPYSVRIQGQEFNLQYEPGEGKTSLFGGNSNWRGPVWFPMNYLIIQSLREYYSYFGNDLKVEFPTNSGIKKDLHAVATAVSDRLISMFRLQKDGSRPLHGNEDFYVSTASNRDLILFYEYFHGDTSCGVGASHQTGWTGLVAELIREVHGE
ncbi:MAG: glucosidase [Saprospiraceae bacterium]